MTIPTESDGTSTATGAATAVRSNAGKGLALAALIIAIISLLLCWVPIVNNLVFFLGVIALVFGVFALFVSVRKKSATKMMSIVALIIAVLSLVGVLATQAMYVAVLDDISASVEEAADGVVPVSEAEQAKAETVEVKALGETAAVGQKYNVAVNFVVLDGTAAVLAANQFNDPPSGQYVVVRMTVEYVGAEEGNPWIDLSTSFVGSDARQYDTSTCRAVVEESAMDVPTLENSGTATYQLCMDVPPAAVEGGKLFVEKTMSFNKDSRVYWAVQ